MSRLFGIPDEWKVNDDNFPTASSHEQRIVEKNVAKYYSYQEDVYHDGRIQLFIRQHLNYLNNSLKKLPQSYQCLDASRPWLVYWILHSLDLLKKTPPEEFKHSIIDFLSRCQSPDGGFGGGPGQIPHLAPTYAAICAVCIVNLKEGYQMINRGVYCATVAARLTNIANSELFKDTPEWIARCQTYEGGIGSIPGMEAHSGYSFCGFAALVLLGHEEVIDCQKLLRWTARKQMQFEGGFQGRTNKLVDGCYSFWQGGLFPLLNLVLFMNGDESIDLEEWLFDDVALQEYVLACCQHPKGGCFDKPGKPRDFYHTCYGLSGLSVAQHVGNQYKTKRVVGDPENELNPTHPVYNINPSHVVDMQKYFNVLSPP
ncbi:Protein farnesyltransferase subunit beta [Trichoplax sp. H2]|nr:Protein farnesyltransferase subunit beta [Trichoplax sp. H2]|eukprot:RDD41265.1 Protein farnesyltransferase subunit beta [Trichoplax sp. H2]